MEIREALRRYADIARREILRDHIRASCIASTWITLDVFRRLGFKAEPLSVSASVGNGAYSAQWKASGPPKSLAELEALGERFGAYVVGVGGGSSPGGIGGHLVCIVESVYVVDASLDQATSTENGLEIPGVIVFESNPASLKREVVRHVDPALFVEYVIKRTAVDYSSSPDWGRTPEVRAAADRILALVLSATANPLGERTDGLE